MEQITEPHEYKNIVGFFNFKPLYRALYDILPDPARIVEVGSFLGKSACYMAELIQAGHKSVEFTTVDTWDSDDMPSAPPEITLTKDFYPMFRQNLVNAGVSDYVRSIKAPSVEGATHFEDGSLDSVFIDANHEYDFVLADLKAWYPKLKPGGILAGDDWAWNVKEGDSYIVRDGTYVINTQGSVLRAVHNMFQHTHRIKIQDSAWFLERK